MKRGREGSGKEDQRKKVCTSVRMIFEMVGVKERVGWGVRKADCREKARTRKQIFFLERGREEVQGEGAPLHE